MFTYLPVAKQQSEPEAIDTNIIRDGSEILRSLFHQCTDQIFRNAAETEAADHDGGAVLYVSDRFVRRRDNLFHGRPTLSRRPLISSLISISPIGHGPNPASALMCPAGPAFSKRLPQAYATSRARLTLSHESEELETSIEG